MPVAMTQSCASLVACVFIMNALCVSTVTDVPLISLKCRDMATKSSILNYEYLTTTAL